jgi:hypothetical protein
MQLKLLPNVLTLLISVIVDFLFINPLDVYPAEKMDRNLLFICCS